MSQEESDRGIVFIGRIPPGMTPGLIRTLLERYAPIDRIYLSPNRIKSSKIKFTEGWVEFLDKKQAKQTAALLNGQTIGGCRGSKKAYSHDLWCLKYLSKFKWIHLTEKIAYERATREQKLHNEIAQAKKENELYLKQVQKGKKMEKAQSGIELSGSTDGKILLNEQEDFESLRKRFKQRKVC